MNNVNLYVSQFVQALKSQQVVTKKSLLREFGRNKTYLLKEFLAWMPKGKQHVVLSKWPPSV